MVDIISLLKNPSESDVCYVAELGINHDGDIQILKKMIDQAIEAKADAVKFQLYDTDRFYNRYVAPDGHSLFQKFYLSYQDFLSLKKYAESRGIQAFAAAFDTITFQQLISDNCYPIKLASGDALTEPWIDELLAKNVPFIISTGSLTDSEIQQLMQKIDNSLSAVLYCVSEYPAPPEGFDIRYLNTMQSYLPNHAIGFSDHSKGIALSLAAIAHGAKIIERHFTIFPEREDLDHPISLSPEKFSELVDSGRMIEKALGVGHRMPTVFEQKVRNLAGRDAYALVDIPANTPIVEEMIILQRPGQGIRSEEYASLLGQSSTQPISKGSLLRNYFL